MSGIWTPIAEGPHEAFVERLHRAIAAFAEEHGVETPVVELELADGSHFVLVKIEPEPGYGMVTVSVQAVDGDEAPDALIIPLGSIRRFELRKTAEARLASFGFNLPAA